MDRQLVEYFRSTAADVYLQRAHDTLAAEGLNPVVQMEFFPERGGIMCGLDSALELLKSTLGADDEVWALR